MKFRTEWAAYLHKLRKCEIEIIFANCPKKLFKAGLELGAGDGFQSRLLAVYVSSLTSTDYSIGILNNKSSGAIDYRICDAEELYRDFSDLQFELVFSSNLLEHLPNPQKALRAISKVLTPDGIAIHVVPSPFWKLCHLLLYIPALAAGFLESTMRGGGLQQALTKIKNFKSCACVAADTQQQTFENNPKINRAPKSFLSRLLIPEPHGISQHNISEFYAFSRSRWIKEFAAADFEVLRIIKGPVTSGYGFGLDSLRHALETIGVTSEYIYITVKRGSSTVYNCYF